MLRLANELHPLACSTVEPIVVGVARLIRHSFSSPLVFVPTSTSTAAAPVPSVRSKVSVFTESQPVVFSVVGADSVGTPFGQVSWYR